MASSRYWLYGRHAVLAALANPERKIYRLALTRAAAQEIDLKKITAPKADMLEPRALEALLPGGAVHQGIAAEVSTLPELDIEDISGDTTRIVVLDQVTDPHNVGAIIRSCAAFGASALILTRDHAPPETGALAKAASGVLETVQIIRVTNLAAALDGLKKQEFWCIGLAGEAKEEFSALGPFHKTAIVMGSEDKGLRRLTREHCDALARLPISSAIESLNVSNAAAVALYELARR